MPLSREEWLGLIRLSASPAVSRLIWQPGDVTVYRPDGTVALGFVKDYLRREDGKVEEVHGYERLSGGKAFGEVMEHQPELDYDQDEALEWYSQDGFGAINGSLRHKQPADERTENAVRLMDKAFAEAAPIERPISVWRGAGHLGLGSTPLEPGSVIADNGYVSTSVNKLAASNFDWHGGYLVHIAVPAGTRALTPWGLEESEVILPRGSRFKVSKVGPEIPGPPDAFGMPSGIKVREVEAELLPPENVGGVRKTAGMAKLTRDQWLGLIKLPADTAGPKYVKLVANQDLTHPMHVKTPAGAKFYKEPIGAVIYAKPHLTPGYESHQKLVYVGGTPYAVPASAKVWVAKNVDLSDPADVDHAGKLIVYGDDVWQISGGTGQVTKLTMTPSFVTPNIYSELDAAHLKKPVFQGTLTGKGIKPAGWVPQDWKVYKVKGSVTAAPWLKAPSGKWYYFDSGGNLAPWTSALVNPDTEVKEGKFELEAPDGTTLLPGDVHPPVSAKAGFTPATIMVPPAIHVNQHQLAEAIDALQSAKSTNVKAPLKKIGSPLADMDYLTIAKHHLDLHPELKTSTGTKKKHVGHTKNAVLHYLAEQQEKVALTDAHTKAALEAKEKAEAEAAHAQALTPAKVYVPVVKPGAKTAEPGDVIGVTKDELAGAITKLEAENLASHKPMKTILAGNALVKADYMGMAKEHKKASGHKENTKTAYLHALQEKQGHAAGQDKESGHDDAAELDQLISSGPPASVFSGDFSLYAQLASALLASHSTGQKLYVNPEGTGLWSMSPVKKPGAYLVSPQHQVYSSGPGGLAVMPQGKVLSILKTQLGKKHLEPHPGAVPKPTAKPEFKVSGYAALQYWKEYKKGELQSYDFYQKVGASPEVWLASLPQDKQDKYNAWAKSWESLKQPEPEELPAALVKQIKQLPAAIPPDAPWIDQLPGGNRVANALEAAKHSGGTVYIYQDPSSGEWVYTAGDKPGPEFLSAGWWEVTADGENPVFHSAAWQAKHTEPVHPAYPPGFEEALAKAQKSLSKNYPTYLETNGTGTHWVIVGGSLPGPKAEYWLVKPDGSVEHHAPETGAPGDIPLLGGGPRGDQVQHQVNAAAKWAAKYHHQHMYVWQGDSSGTWSFCAKTPQDVGYGFAGGGWYDVHTNAAGNTVALWTPHQEPSAADQAAQSALDELVKHSKFPGPVTDAKKQDYGWALSMALKWATAKGSDRYLVNEGGYWDIKSGQPEMGSHAAPGTAFTRVTTDRKVIGVDTYGEMTYADPQAVLAQVKPWLESTAAFTPPPDLAGVTPPTHDEAVELLAKFSPGSKLYQVTGEGPLKGAFYGQSKSGLWYLLPGGAAAPKAAQDQSLVDGWAASGVLKKVAYKNSAGVHEAGKPPAAAWTPSTPAPASAAATWDDVQAEAAKADVSTGASVGPENVKLSQAIQLSAQDPIQARYVYQLPGGQWSIALTQQAVLLQKAPGSDYYKVEGGGKAVVKAWEGGEMTLTPSDVLAVLGKAEPEPEPLTHTMAANLLAPEPPEGVVKNMPHGASLYYEPATGEWFAKTATATPIWWKMSETSGHTPGHSKAYYDQKVDAGELQQVPYGTEAIPIQVEGKTIGHVPAGSQVYVGSNVGTGPGTKSVADAAKYIKQPDGTWQTTKQVDGQWALVTVSPQTGQKYSSMFTAGDLATLAEAQAKEAGPSPASGLGEVLAKAAANATVPVYVNHLKVGEAPAGSKFYTGAGAADPAAAVKYVQFPDGKTWKLYSDSGITDEPDDMPTSGTVALSPEQLDASAPPAGTKPLVVDGKHVANIPAGAAVYKDAISAASKRWIKNPDGTWSFYNSGEPGLKNGGDYQHSVDSGAIVPAEEEPAGGETAGSFTIPYHGYQIPVPSGAKVYVSTSVSNTKLLEDKVKIIKLPGGKWVKTVQHAAPGGGPGLAPTLSDAETWEKKVAEGSLVPFQPQTDSHLSLKDAAHAVYDSLSVHQKGPASGNLHIKLAKAIIAAYGGAAKYIKPQHSGLYNISSAATGAAYKVESVAGTVHVTDLKTGQPLSDDTVKALLKPSVTMQDVTPVHITVDGKDAGTAPAGSAVYAMTDMTEGQKWVKYPDGTWYVYNSAGPHKSSAQDSNQAAALKADNGEPDANLQHISGPTVSSLAGKKPGAAAPEPAEQPVSGAPDHPYQILMGGKVVQIPAGVKVYKGKKYSYSSESFIAQMPGGEWWDVYEGGPAKPYSTYATESYPDYVSSGKFTEVKPATEEDVAHATALAALKDKLTTSAVTPGVSATWQEEAAKALTDQWPGAPNAQYHDQYAVYQGEDGKWKRAYYIGSVPDSADKYLITKNILQVQHLAPGQGISGGKSTEVPYADVLKIGDYLTPDAVAVPPQDSLHGEPKLLKYGFYYKPKGSAALEVKAPIHGAYGYNSLGKYGMGAKASYIYHSPSGQTSEKTPTFASKWLENADYFGTTEKSAAPASPGAAPLSYVTTLAPGDYQIYGWEGGVAGKVSLHPDGSATIQGGAAGTTQQLASVEPLATSGTLLDHYGTTVVVPGTAPKEYHLWGSGKLTAEQLAAFRDELHQHAGDTAACKAVLQKYIPDVYANSKANTNLKAFANAHQATTADAQVAAITGLLTELLNAPEMTAAKPVVAKYYKGLPSGFKTAKDVFTFTPAGYAHPFDGEWMPGYGSIDFQPYLLNSTELTKVIKEVSDQYGGGKVVGLHPSGLTKDEKAQWLKAWREGDMTSVFALDVKSGKVSPLHPGAPKNKDTHKVIWAPWGEGEVPATTDIAPKGIESWSDPQYASQDEVNNYLVLAGLQHAEYLTHAERRKWLTSHRAHDQEAVDALSKDAWTRWKNGASALTGPLAWVRDVKPAKSYTVKFENKDPASDWSLDAVNDFAADHGEELAPFAKAQGTTVQGASSYTKRALIQSYLDELAAKEEAERLRPKYHIVTGEAVPPGLSADQMLVEDQFGHQFVFRQPDPADAQRELAAYTLARLWGFKSPPAQPLTIEDSGITGIGQQYLPGTTTLDPAKVPDLTPRQAADLAAEHVLDWALDNPDGAPSNYLLYGDGIVGIDKDAAFSKPPGEWDGLGPGAGSYATHAPSLLYDAIRHHQVSQETAGAAYVAAIRAARRMSLLTDKRMAEVLAAGGLSTKNAAALVERKNSLEADVSKLWEDIYHDAGWKPPEIPKENLTHGLHSGFTEPTYFDHVMAAKSFGVPAFFGGTGLHSGNMLTWTELAGENRLVRGEGAIVTGPALDKVVAWCKAHEQGAEKLHGDSSYGSVSSPPEPTTYTVKGAATWSANIIEGAKAVSKVNAGGGGWTKDGGLPPAMNQTGYTAGQLQKFKDAKTGLLTAQANMEKAIKAGPSSKVWAAEEQQWGAPPDIVNQAVKYYLDQVAQVENAKTHAGTFQPGSLPEWKAPKIPKKKEAKKAEPPKPVAAEVKVIKTGAVRDLAWNGPPDEDEWELGKEDRELHTTGKVYSYKGNVWKVTLPTGEVIEVNDEDETYTPPGQVGRIRFRADASHGAQSLENIRAQLQDMGLELPEATDPDMELLYWRLMTHTLAGRPDRYSGQYTKVWDSLRAALSANGKSPGTGQTMPALNKVADHLAELDPETETEAYRAAWAKVVGQEKVDEWVEKKRYLPHLGHFDPTHPDITGGKPYWYRIEADPETVDKVWGNPIASDTGGAITHVLKTGVMASTEARLRALGLWADNTSSTTDMNTTGGGGVVYLRPANYGISYANYVVSPRVQARVSTYSFSSDAYGSLKKRPSESYYDLDKARNQSTETLPNDALSVLDDLELIEVSNSTQRAKLIKYYKDHGVTEVRGLPIEDRIVPSITSAAVKKARDAAIAGGTGWIDQPGEAYVPPVSGVVTHSIITTAATKKGAEEAANAMAKAGDHDAKATAPAASAEKVNKVFYKMAGVDPQASNSEKRAKIKHDTADRLADAMTASDEQLAALAAAAGLSAPEHWGDTERARIIAAILGKWATGSTDPVIIALQHEATKVFGLPSTYFLPPGAEGEKSKELEEKFAPVLDNLLATMWNLTQDDFSAGDADNVTVYRLFKFNPSDAPVWAKGAKAGETITAAPSYPWSAWALSPQAINSDIVWGSGSQSVLVKTTVPRQLLLSYPRSGFGSYLQGEVDVLNHTGTWEVVSGPGDSIAATACTGVESGGLLAGQPISAATITASALAAPKSVVYVQTPSGDWEEIGTTSSSTFTFSTTGVTSQ